MSISSHSAVLDVARETLDRSRHHLLALQSDDGHWRGLLETNVTIDAEDLLLREFLGVRDAAQTKRTARWIRARQRDDGTWATFPGGPGDLSTSVEAYTALRLAGDDAAAAHMRRAAEFVRDAGGVEATRVFTRIWLSLFGLCRWSDTPALPPELLFLPPWAPLNVYDFACWARQTIVPLTIVWAHQPRHPIGFDMPELRSGSRRGADDPLWSIGGAFRLLDRGLHAYERRPLAPLRQAALRRAERFIVDRQEADGSWGGIQPPWVYSLIALRLLGYPLESGPVRHGLDGLDRFTVESDEGRWIEACQSPVWDTALGMLALIDAGGAETDAVGKATDWILDREVRRLGDWAVRRPSLAPGGWSFEYANEHYPDIDDTAVIMLALRRARSTARAEAALGRAATWVEAMQSQNGGWGAFDADNTRGLCRQLPFCDFGEVIDPPSADVTAHVVEALCAEPTPPRDAIRRGVKFLLAEQERDGSWFGRWGANHVYGTAAVLPALIAAGLRHDSEPVRRAVAWLESVQNPDGGFGEDLRSYRDAKLRGDGRSTPSQTAWGLIGLVAADRRGDAASRAVAWLADTQRADGGWDEPLYTGTGFPGDFYIGYHLYRLVFPVMALGRLVRAEQQAT